MPRIKKILLSENQMYPNVSQERTIIDYDFTTTNPSDGLLGSGAGYGYKWSSGNGIQTYNTSVNDRGGRAVKLIDEDLAGHIVTMDGTWYATIGDTRTGLGFGFCVSNDTGTSSGANWIGISLGLTAYSGYPSGSGYDNLNCPGISNGTGQKITGYGGTTVGTGTWTIRLKSIFDFINWTVTTEVYRNGTLLNIYNYTLTSAEQTTVRGYISSTCYYKAQFTRGYNTSNIWMRNRKIVVQ